MGTNITEGIVVQNQYLHQRSCKGIFTASALWWVDYLLQELSIIPATFFSRFGGVTGGKFCVREIEADSQRAEDRESCFYCAAQPPWPTL